MFDLDFFISKYVTMRDESMFSIDIKSHYEELSEKINGKRVLVIGGAGSIGSSFIKAILPFNPSSLVVADINENALAELTRDIRSAKDLVLPSDYVPYPMDYSSKVFEKMFISRTEAGKSFDIVANFSAHKHVRSEKDIFSVEALLKNNILNAKKFLDLLNEYPPEEYFCVSTDKAANPVNIMGASKRIMEDLIFSYSDRFPVKTARFANVAFSNGSLPAGFIARMSRLQPISAPSDVKRYFVSPEESGQICMLSAMLGNNREIFFPKLNSAQMMSFDKIAEAFIRENGFEVMYCDSDEEAIEKAIALKNGSKYYPVHFSKSDTSGEKPYEEFYTVSESTDMDRFSSLGIITGKEIPDREKVDDLINDMQELFKSNYNSKEKIIRLIENYLPNFRHIETGKSLDSKM